jgi:hypothetical protein
MQRKLDKLVRIARVQQQLYKAQVLEVARLTSEIESRQDAHAAAHEMQTNSGAPLGRLAELVDRAAFRTLCQIAELEALRAQAVEEAQRRLARTKALQRAATRAARRADAAEQAKLLETAIDATLNTRHVKLENSESGRTISRSGFGRPVQRPEAMREK